MQALGLKIGDGESDLISTEKAIRELSRGISHFFDNDVMPIYLEAGRTVRSISVH